MLSPIDNDGAKRFWLATKEREMEAMRRMCAYYILNPTAESDMYYMDFKIVLSWYQRHKGVFHNVPQPEPKG